LIVVELFNQEKAMPYLEEIESALAELKEDLVLQLVKDALAAQVSAHDILTACQAGLTEVGRRFECRDYVVSDLMMSGEIFREIGIWLEPELKANGSATTGKIVFGTVKGDIHDIGKDIVVNTLRSANFDVIDLGVDVPPEIFVNTIRETGAKVVAMSGLLTLALESMKATIRAFEIAGLRRDVKVMIGGSPVDANACRFVGADDWGSSAQQAVKLATVWLTPHTEAKTR
jgi:methanogenic corrinoid protein MtbC1